MARTKKLSGVATVAEVAARNGVEERLLEGANEEQAAVIRHGAGPLLASAVAGSGKTRALVRRIAWLVQVSGVVAHRILAVTFSKKAADEMNARLVTLLPDDLQERPRVGTFHSWALEVLRAEQPAYKEWTIDDRDRYRICVKDAVGFRGMNWRDADITSLASYVGRCKADLAKPGSDGSRELASKGFGYQAGMADEAYARAEQNRKDQKLITFDDMLVVAHDLLSDESTGAVHRWAGRYDYVLQDEAQDANRAQCELARLLSREHRNYMVVGDAAQTIYTWRGARPEYFLGFEQEWSATVISMFRNYRCGARIVEAANRVIEPAKARLPELMAAESGIDGEVTFDHESTMDDEAGAVVGRIQAAHVDGRKWSDVLVLYRTNAQSRAPEEALLGAKVPYVVIGGTNFYERREVRDLLAYLRLAEGRGNADDVRRAINSPFRFLGRAFVDRLMEMRGGPGTWSDRVRVVASQERIQRRQESSAYGWADMMERLHEGVSGREPAGMLDEIVHETGYLDYLRQSEGEESPENSRVSNVKELVRAAGRFQSCAQLLDYIEQIVDASKKQRGRDEERPDRVTLMSIHRSKGLESPIVHVIGCNEGILPHGRCEDEEEERRLCYVAFTRAKERLHVSAVKQAAVGPKVVELPVSRYVVAAGLVAESQGVMVLPDDPVAAVQS